MSRSPAPPPREESASGEESLKPEISPMENFKGLARKILAVSREELAAAERVGKKLRKP
jgi:hypothetical protein